LEYRGESVMDEHAIQGKGSSNNPIFFMLQKLAMWAGCAYVNVLTGT